LFFSLISFGRSDDPCYRRSFFACRGDGVQCLEKRDPFSQKIPHPTLFSSVSRIPFFVSKILKFKTQWRTQGRGLGGLGPPYFGTKLRPEGPKHFLGRPPPPPPPPLSQGLDPALKRPIAAEANKSVRR